jgi:hypothetical protein
MTGTAVCIRLIDASIVASLCKAALRASVQVNASVVFFVDGRHRRDEATVSGANDDAFCEGAYHETASPVESGFGI